jgi:hypothetical protein
VWTVDFETPVCKLYLLFLSANAAQEKEKKMLLPIGVSKSTAHAVLYKGDQKNPGSAIFKCETRAS